MYGLDGVALLPLHVDMSFGELLRERRLARGLTQADLAHSLGVRQQAVGRWEADKDLPRRETIRVIADQLDISGEQIAVAMGYVDEPDDEPDEATVLRLPKGVRLTTKQQAAVSAILDAFLDNLDPNVLASGSLAASTTVRHDELIADLYEAQGDGQGVWRRTDEHRGDVPQPEQRGEARRT